MEEASGLVARAWAPGTDFPQPFELNWLYHFGLAVICILWTLSLTIVCLRIWSRWNAKQLGVGKSVISDSQYKDDKTNARSSRRLPHGCGHGGEYWVVLHLGHV
jgi:hypothetical protein